MSRIKNNLIYVILVLIAIIMPFFNSTILISICVVAFIYSIAALGLNIVVGWTDLLDLGASGFAALGAYITAIILLNTGISSFLIILIGALFGFIMGVILGIPTLKHRSDYFAILTLGFAELVSLLIRNWTPVTGGSYGLSNIPNLSFFGHDFVSIPPKGYYYLSLFLLLFITTLLFRLRKSKIGRYFHMIKNNEDVAKVYGINPSKIKIIAFGTSASIVSVSGVLWASYYSALTWSQFNVLLSCIFLSLIIVGGSGNIKGVLLGAISVSASIEVIRIILVDYNLPQNTRFLFFSLLLILFIRLKPKGLIPDKPLWINDFPFKNIKLKKIDKIKKEGKKPIILSCNKITKSFGGIQALKNISLEIFSNEIIGILGPNGSGKTTLLNIISGLITHDNGEIIYKAKNISKIKAHKRANMGIRRSFQHNFIFDDISGIDNIFLPMKSNSNKIQLNDFIKNILKKKTLSINLSYGEKKILDVVRLFSNAPENSLLLMDEPTSGLNQEESSQLLTYLNSYKNNSLCSMIIVSHDVKFLENLELDRAIILHSGEKFAEGKITDLKDDMKVREIFWG